MSKYQPFSPQIKDDAKNLIINQINAGQNIDPDNLKLFLKNGGDINKPVLRSSGDQDSHTFLSLAIEKDNHQALDSLIGSGASLNTVIDYVGQPAEDEDIYPEEIGALRRAINLNKPQIFSKLLTAGADITIDDYELIDLIITNIINNNETEILNITLDYFFYDFIPINYFLTDFIPLDKIQNTKFHLLKKLIESGHIEQVEKIVNADKIDLNFKTESDESLLNIATKQGNFRLVELFGAKGARFEETANNSLMSLAVTRSTTPEEKINRLEIVKLFITKGLKADSNSINQAINYGYVDILELLVQNSSEAVNYQELFEAATSDVYCIGADNRVQIIQLCLKNGLKLTQDSFNFISNPFPNDPESKLALIKLLLTKIESISPINIMDLFNLAATSQNCFAVVQYLKTQFNLDLNGVDSKGDNPLESFVKNIQPLNDYTSFPTRFLSNGNDDFGNLLMYNEPDFKILQFLLNNIKWLDQEETPILEKMRVDSNTKEFNNRSETAKVAKFLIAKGAIVTKNFITKVIESQHAQLLKVLIEENAQDPVTKFNVKEYFFTGEGSSLVHKFEHWGGADELYSLFLRECDNLNWLSGFPENHTIHAQIKLANSLFNLEDLANYSTNDFSYNHDFVQARLEYHLKDKDFSFLRDFHQKLIDKYGNNQELCDWVMPIVQEKINITIENEALDVILPSIVAEISGILPMPLGLILEHLNSEEKNVLTINEAKLEQTLDFYKKDAKLEALIEQYKNDPSSALISKINIAAREVLENYIADNLENLENHNVFLGISEINDLTHVKLPENLMDKIYEVIEHHNESMEDLAGLNVADDLWNI